MCVCVGGYWLPLVAMGGVPHRLLNTAQMIKDET